MLIETKFNVNDDVVGLAVVGKIIRLKIDFDFDGEKEELSIQYLVQFKYPTSTLSQTGWFKEDELHFPNEH